MTEDEKKKAVNMEDMQAHSRRLMNKGIINEGTCTTAAGTAAKQVILNNTFLLANKATVIVTFQNAITVANATLAIGKTESGETTYGTAYPIKYRGTALAADMVKAGDTVILRLVYDSETPANSYWNVVGTLDTDTNTVTDVSFNANTGKLQKTVNGQTSDITTIVNSGFSLTEDDTNGIDILTAIGSATITDDNTNGLDILNF